MKNKITIILCLVSLLVLSQEKKLFDEFYEFKENKIKVYLDGSYKVMYKQCAKYYMTCEINNKLEYNDSVQIFDIKGRIIVQSFFKESKLNGNYISYFTNGQISDTGVYNTGLRIGLWNFYYDNGQLKKVIDFGEGIYYPKVMSFYKMNGDQKVVNGNGKFEDLISTSISSSRLIKYTGKIKNGELDGIWKIEDGGNLTAKETFDNGLLVEGISYSLMVGNQKYNDNPSSTIYGINHLEFVKILGPSYCNKATIGLSKINSTQSDLYNAMSKNTIEFNDSWYFVEVNIDKNGNFINAFEFPKNDLLNSIIIKELKYKKTDTTRLRSSPLNQLFLIFFKDDEVYFGHTDKINNFILNFRY
jgi:antitoxin component YwqK of YwqJK toxin-antitoxin module